MSVTAGVAAFVLVGAGCGPSADTGTVKSSPTAPRALECQTDEDCGFSACSIRNIRSPRCVDKSCQVVETECDEGKVCVQDSRGVKCADALPAAPPEKPAMSCNLNSNTLQVTGVNAFNDSWFSCGADCPKGYTCDIKTCLCEEDPDPGAPQGCADEPLFAYSSDTAGIKGLKDNYEEFTTLGLDVLGAQDKEDYIEEGKKVIVPAYNRGKKYFPFPKEQFAIREASPNHVPCANEFYDSFAGIDINRTVVASPGDCGFGPTGVMDGYLLLCPEDLFDWYDSIEALDVFGFVEKALEQFR